MDDALVAILNGAKTVARSGDPKALHKFRADLAYYLDSKQSCPAALFEDILTILRSVKLSSYSEYGSLLSDLAMASFVFSPDQASALVSLTGEMFFAIGQPISRMEACVLLLAFQSRELAARQLLQLLREAKQVNGPQAELVWELAALRQDENVSGDTRAAIARSLPGSRS